MSEAPSMFASVAGELACVGNVIIFVALGDLVIGVDEEEQAAAPFNTGELYWTEQLGIAAHYLAQRAGVADGTTGGAEFHVDVSGLDHAVVDHAVVDAYHVVFAGPVADVDLTGHEVRLPSAVAVAGVGLGFLEERVQ